MFFLGNKFTRVLKYQFLYINIVNVAFVSVAFVNVAFIYVAVVIYTSKVESIC